MSDKLSYQMNSDFLNITFFQILNLKIQKKLKKKKFQTWIVKAFFSIPKMHRK